MAPHSTGSPINMPSSLVANIDGKSREPIAIIGFSFKFPQDATTSDALWDLMLQKRSTATTIPKERMNSDSMYHPDAQRRGTFPVQKAHFIDGDLAAFDAPFFTTSTSDASSMDPQQRYLLECTYQALENAGLPMEKVSGTKTSVYSGSFSTDWQQIQHKDPDEFQTSTALGVQPCFNANRVSWFFNFTGNSANVDTACSSSLVGLDMAFQGLQLGDANMSIVVGSNVIISPDNMHSLTNLNMLSPEGECYSFDHRANGYSRGEGVGVLVLKRVSDAIRDGDTIRGIIRSTGCNQDGHTSSITLPSALMQEQLIRDTYEKAGLSMEPTRFFEAHGTGTPVGDPIESKGLGSAFRRIRSPDDPLWVGAIKSNIGHLEGASGIAGMIKALLVLEKGIIPPNNNFEKVNPLIDTDFLNIQKPQYPRESIPWPVKGLRRASVNSFGNAGTNAHVILDDVYHFLKENCLTANHLTVEYPNLEDATDINFEDSSESKLCGKEHVLFFSANDQAGVKRQANAYSAYFSKPNKDMDAAYLENLAYTLSLRRTQFDWRSFAIVNSVKDLPCLDSILSPVIKSTENPAIGFLFTGQGAQWAGMGSELMHLPLFSESLKRSERFLLSMGCEWHLCEEIMRKDGSRVNSPEIAQPGCTALQMALLELLEYFGVTPTVVVGHSSGEIGAAYCIGALSFESALRLAYYRGQLSATLEKTTPAVKRGMISVGLSRDSVKPFIEEVETRFGISGLTIACINSPKNVTLSGNLDQIDAIKKVLDEKRIFSRKLLVSNAYHSPHMLAVEDAYRQKIQNLKPGIIPSKPVAMISSLTGARVEAADLLSLEYWITNMVSPVNFLGAIETLLTASSQRLRRKLDLSHRKYFTVDTLIEIGPHSALHGPVNDIMLQSGESKIRYASLMFRNQSANMTLFKALGFLWCLGYPVDVLKINSLKPNPYKHYFTLPDLPEYVFDHSQRYWDEPKLSKQYRLGGQKKLALLGRPVNDWNPLEPRWRNFLRVSEMPWIEDHCVNGMVIYPGAGMLAMVIEAGAQLTAGVEGLLGFDLTEIFFKKPLKISTDTMGIDTNLLIRLNSTFARPLSEKVEFRVFSYQDDGWQENCHGSIQARYQETDNDVDDGSSWDEELKSFRQRALSITKSCKTFFEPSQFYSTTQKSGLGLGPSFHLVTAGGFDSQMRVSGTIQPFIWPEDQYPEPHVIHPTTLDAVLHMGFAALTKGGQVTTSTMIPTFIQSIFLSKEGLSSPHTAAFKHNACLRERASGADVSGFALNAAEDSLLVHFEDMRLTTVAENADPLSSKDPDTPQSAYHVSYKPEPDLLSPTMLSAIYHKKSKGFQSQLDHYLDLLSHKNSGMHILQIEPKNIQQTAQLLRTLSVFDNDTGTIVNQKYHSFCLGCQSDGLIEMAKEKFHTMENTSAIKFHIEDDPAEQLFDIVLAPCTIKRSTNALQNVTKILSPHGKLILLEDDHQNDMRDNHMEDTTAELGLVLTNLTLSSPNPVQIYLNTGTPKPAVPSKKVFFLLDSSSALQSKLATELAGLWRNQGIEISNSGNLQDAIVAEDVDSTVFVALLELDYPFIHNLGEQEYILLKQFFQNARDVLWVTSDGDSIPGNPEYAIIQGLTRVLRNEYSHLNVTVATFEMRLQLTESQIESITRLLVDRHIDPKPWIVDAEFREIDGSLQIPRVAQDIGLTRDLYRRARSQILCQLAIQDAPPLAFAFKPGSDANVAHFEEDKSSSSPLKPDEVEVQVEAIGMSSADNFLPQGQLLEPPLFLECAGIVTRMAASTSFQLGDRVMLAAPAPLKTYSRGKIAVRIPESLSSTTAAAIPADFGSAWAILHRLARLEENETVLVHSAASTMGQAVIQVAKLLDARVLATVGSKNEKVMLISEYNIPEDHIFYEGDRSFENRVLEVTKGRGVEVIINTLTGDGFEASWKCIAFHGRFIEMPRPASTSSLSIPSFATGKNASFTMFHLHLYITERPTAFCQDLERVMELFVRGKLRSPARLQVRDISQIGDAFKEHSNEHMVKYVFKVSLESKVQAIIDNSPSFYMKSDQTFVIAGGLGGIGRASARWMASRGAKNLILLSRFGPRNDHSIQLIKELNAMGVRVETPACDVTDINAVRAVFEKLAPEMPPIKGIIQASIVARDYLFDELKYPDWKIAVECKTVGSWNLHTVLPKGMDFFILLASASALAGIKGQANYNAGNVYEDAIARFRVSIGEQAVSFDLGAMADDGILAENQALLSRVHGYGVLDLIKRETFYGLLDYYCNPELPLLTADKSQLAFGLGTAGGGALETLDHSRQPMLQPLVLEGEKRSARSGGSSITGLRIRDRFAASESLENAAQIFAEAAIEKLAKSLASMKDGASVDHFKPLLTYGVDSLLAIELRNWIFKEFNSDVAVFETQGSSTLGTLSMLVAGRSAIKHDKWSMME
ncbi:unnamed protein product [Penicillium glandicola]